MKRMTVPEKDVDGFVSVNIGELAKRQGKPYGLVFKDLSGGFTNTTRGGPQAVCVFGLYFD